MFNLALSLAIASLLACGRIVELYFMGIGQPALNVVTRRDFVWSSLVACWYIAAAFVSVYEYFGKEENTDPYIKSEDNVNGSIFDSNSSTCDGSHHRFLANDSVSENRLPIYLVLTGSLGFTAATIVMVMSLPGGGRHKA